MRGGSCILTLALMGVLALPGSLASAQPYSQYDPEFQDDVGIFYDRLAPYGDWLELEDHGWSWAPRVERGWRPYTRGQWIMTDYGWYWDSDEPFGWATYHYGRWVNDRYYGWFWVPGTEWAPAWVSWRHGNGYTGWAPLPPRARWQTHVGLRIGGIDIDAFIGARDYAFVQDRAFVDRGIYQRVLPPTQNLTIIDVTTNVTNYGFVNRRVVNGGIAVAAVERAVGRGVPRARTVDVDRADAPRRARADEVAVYRPALRAAPERRPAQGRSLVRGEAPPPLLVERRQERERERQQRGSELEVTAKDVEQRRPAARPRDDGRSAAGQPQTPRTDERAQQQEAQRQREQAQRDAGAQREKDLAQQKLDAEAQADRRAKDAQQGREQRQRDQQQQLDQRRAKQADDAQAQADRRAKDAQQGREQRQRDQQEQLDQQRAKQADDKQARPDKPAKNPQQQTEKGAKGKDKKNPKASPTPPPAGEQ